MNDIVICLTNVSKAYTLRQPEQSGLFRKKNDKQIFLALSDASLEIPRGKALGILGLNGSGKSTLLNIVAGNIAPTSGQIAVRGRVQLLDLGGNFVPSMSGRENVIAYARARGLGLAEQERRVEYVEKFADIGQFFDQPLKTYSSGMRSRVAFGNAFADNPEILIIDESLAVGDAVFVNKCYRKIFEVRESGATLLYVSHSIDSVLRLCDLGIVLHKGEIVENGTVLEAARAYAEITQTGKRNSLAENEPSLINKSIANEVLQAESSILANFHDDGSDRLSLCRLYNKQEQIIGAGGARIVEAYVTSNGIPLSSRGVDFDSTLEVCVKVCFERVVTHPNFGFTLNDHQGIIFYGTNQYWRGDDVSPAAPGDIRFYKFSFPSRLARGDWFLTLAIGDREKLLQSRQAALYFMINSESPAHSGRGWLAVQLGSVSLDGHAS